ncbi:MAG: hypothetical protein GEV07_21780 [Streptosporangiales bacterium]|nr:hypothetical protein [Streptosporangiales bacterium]
MPIGFLTEHTKPGTHLRRRQFAILGAGFDTRSFRLVAAPGGGEAFELDLPGTAPGTSPPPAAT